MARPSFVMRYRVEYPIGALLRRNPHRVLARILRRSWWLGKSMILSPLSRRHWLEDRSVDLLPPGVHAVAENLQQKRGLLESFTGEFRGVIHVGGHDGQELENYLALGFGSIVFFEGDPVVCERLQSHVGFWQSWLDLFGERYGLVEGPSLSVVLQALGERRERATFHATSVDQQSSLLSPTGVVGGVERSFEVEVDRLDGALAVQGLRPDDFNILVIDVQGGELAVLKGAPEMLAKLEVILCEVAFEARYEGQPLVAELDSFLAEAGFRRAETSRWSSTDPSGDALYLRRTVE